MSDVAVLSELRDDIGFLTLNRAAKGNALSADLVQALSNGIDDHMARGARMLVFQGEGRHLCTGFDLSNLETQTDADLLLRFVNVELLLQKIFAAPVLTVAVGKGRVFGAGADLFCACHRRIAVAASSYAFPGSAFGIILGTRRLAVRIGASNAQSMLVDGRTLSDIEAAELGLTTEIVPEDAVEAALARHRSAAERFDQATIGAILDITTSRAEESDLANLVRSAARPGLSRRIALYRDQVRAQLSPKS